tara:strand:- start:385 stop:1533 length:1149 start_codon:yes stop_codon:yes gene_type:complete
MKIKNITLGLGIIICILFFFIFYFNKNITNNLYKDRKNEITNIVKTYAEKINSSDSESGLYAAREIAPLISFPILFEFNNKTSAGFNLEKKFNLYNENEILNIKKEMISVFKPQFLINQKDTIGKLYYGISKSEVLMINRIKILPALEITFIILLSILLYIQSKASIKNNKNKIYATMAKETAHQLGTPLSSLLGWTEIIKNEIKHDQYLNIINDLDRLKEISNRFGKIGDKPKLNEVNINALIKSVLKYYQTKIPKSVKIQLIYSNEKINKIMGDKTLLFWAFENLIKNSIDSIKGDGIIKITQKEFNNKIFLYISDTGSGIKKNNYNKIFKPGFSTKKNNWGIGLTLTNRILTDIHNSKFLLSKSSSKGTEFKIIFNIIN